MPESNVVVAPDDVHNHAVAKDGGALVYDIPPCTSLRFDPTGYTIPIPKKSGLAGPNSIHLIHAKDEYFRAPWDGKMPVTLEPAFFTNIRGTNRFAGFASGETYILGVGHDNYPEPEMKFSVMWVGMMKVK